MAQDVNIAVKVDTKEATKSVDNLGKSFDTVSKKSSQAKEQSSSLGKELLNNGQVMGKLSQLTGGFSDVVVKSVKGLDMANLSLKAMKTALASVGIGLITIALGYLIDNFDKLGKWVNQAIDYFSSMGSTVKNVISIMFPIVGVIRLIYAGLQELGIVDSDYTREAKKNAMIRAEAGQKSADAQRKALEKIIEGYDFEIAKAKASGENTYKLESRKLNAIIATEKAILDQSRAWAMSGQATQEQIKAFNENKKSLEKHFKEKALLNVEHNKEISDKTKEANDNAKKEAQEQYKALKALEKKYRNELEDLNDKTQKEKLETQKKRALQELDQIKMSESAKSEAVRLINADFAKKNKDFDKTQQDKKQSLFESYKRAEEDILAKSDTEKLILKQKRDSETLEKELLTLEVSESEKNELRKKLQGKFALEKSELTKKINEADALESQKVLEDIMSDSTSSLEQKQSALNAEQKMLEDQKTAMLISEETYNAKTKVLSESRKKMGELEVAWKRQQVALMGNQFSALSQLAGESTSAGKAFAVASTAISTYATAQKAYESAFEPVKTTYSPILGSIYAGIAVAGGLANIQKILSVKTPSGGGGGGMPSGGATPAPAQFNVVGASGTNQIAESINATNKVNDKPLKAYVVSSDVTTGQNLDSKIVQNATLGK